jgi:hypothetical protein
LQLKLLRSSRLRAEHPARWFRFESPSLMAEKLTSLAESGINREAAAHPEGEDEA